MNPRLICCRKTNKSDQTDQRREMADDSVSPVEVRTKSEETYLQRRTIWLLQGIGGGILASDMQRN
jgi:hypothetical protein